jgi:Na+-translocating ferredoxin:NAD+ oxidoreductase RnfC subunit
VVKRGDTVTRGQVIAAADGDVSSAVHASINGRVEDVLANEILIRRA